MENRLCTSCTASAKLDSKLVYPLGRLKESLVLQAFPQSSILEQSHYTGPEREWNTEQGRNDKGPTKIVTAEHISADLTKPSPRAASFSRHLFS